MTTGILVFARLDSHRLPGKVLADIEGRPMISWVIDRCARVPDIDEVVLCTSDRPVDDPLAEWAAGERVTVFRGDGRDVLGRAVSARERHGFDRVVRISGDSPFVDPALIDEVRNVCVGDVELATNVFPRTFPPGVSAEVLTADALTRLDAEAVSDADREHVTSAIYRTPSRWQIANVAAPDDRYAGVVLTVDQPADLDAARAIAGRLRDARTASLDEIVAAHRALAPARAADD